MRAATKLTWVELKLFAREPMTLAFTFAFPVFVLFVLANVFGNEVEVDPDEARIWRNTGPANYYVAAYIALVVAAVGLVSLPVHLANYRERGVLRRFRASGVPLPAIFASQAAVLTLLSAVGGLTVVVLSSVVYGTQGPDAPLLALAGFVPTVLAFSSLGLLLGSALPNARSAQAAGLLLFFVMMFLCGAGPPREVLGSGVRAVGSFLPLTYAILVLQDPWLGFGFNLGAIAVLLGFVAGSGMIALRFFRWE